MSVPLLRGLRVLALGGLFALLPAAPSARAEADLLPPVAQLFAWNAAAPVAAGPATCAASQAAALPQLERRREAALARIAQLVQAEPGGTAEPLDGRGYAYPVRRDPAAELRWVVMEAQRRRELRAASQQHAETGD